MLTEKQHQTLIFIQEFVRDQGFSPSTAEIAAGIGIRSRGVAYRYVLALQDAGYLRLQEGRRRNIELCDLDDSEAALPLLGQIAAGAPIEAIPESESIEPASWLLGPGRYALKVNGDSMIDEGILDGDIIVCQEASTARDHQIVVALIDREWVTLKRLCRLSGGRVALKPANAEHEVQIYEGARVEIQGIFVGLMRLSE